MKWYILSGLGHVLLFSLLIIFTSRPPAPFQLPLLRAELLEIAPNMKNSKVSSISKEKNGPLKIQKHRPSGDKKRAKKTRGIVVKKKTPQQLENIPQKLRREKALRQIRTRVVKARKNFKRNTLLKRLQKAERRERENLQRLRALKDVLPPDVVERVRRAVERCWVIPTKLPERARARILAIIGRDRIVRSLELLSYRPDQAMGLELANSALRALRNPACMPLPLPKKGYLLWRKIIFNFSPRGVLSGL